MPNNDLTKQVIPELPGVIDKPQPTTGFSGVYKQLSTGLLFELCVDKYDIRGRTHKARVPEQKDKQGNTTHPGLFWEGTADEFRAIFEKQ